MSKKILIILNIAIILGSCKPRENLFLGESAIKLNDAELEKLIINKNKEIETIKLGKINISLQNNGEEYKSGGTIGIIKDSVIVISLVPALGYEISRIFCYKDKILVLDRIEKTFFYESLQKNMEKYNIRSEYKDIVSLLTGGAFIYGINEHETKLRKSIERESDKFKLNYEIIKNELPVSTQEITVRKEGLLTESNIINDLKENSNLNIYYDQFINVEGFNLPQYILISVDSPERNLKILLEIGIIIINEQINAESTIPQRYSETIIDN